MSRGSRITLPPSEIFGVLQGHVIEMPPDEIDHAGRAALAAIWYARFKHGDARQPDEILAAYAGMKSRGTFIKAVKQLEDAKKIRVTRHPGAPRDYDILDAQGRSLFDITGTQAPAPAGNPKPAKTEDPEDPAWTLRPFTDGWVAFYAEFFHGAVYDYKGAKDTEAAQTIIRYCKRIKPRPDNPMALVRFAWKAARSGAFSKYAKERLKTINGFSEVINEIGIGWAKQTGTSTGSGEVVHL